MKPRNLGRAMGIGVRVAGRIAGERMAASAAAPAAPAAAGTAPQAQASGRAVEAERGAAQLATATPISGKTIPSTKDVGRGVAGLLRPFHRVGRSLVLEVVGVFFLLFVLVFAPTAWRTRASMMHGPDHRTFLSAAAIVVVFLYLSVTSFLRARRR
jgi:hypothetical protein